MYSSSEPAPLFPKFSTEKKNYPYFTFRPNSQSLFFIPIVKNISNWFGVHSLCPSCLLRQKNILTLRFILGDIKHSSFQTRHNTSGIYEAFLGRIAALSQAYLSQAYLLLILGGVSADASGDKSADKYLETCPFQSF